MANMKEQMQNMYPSFLLLDNAGLALESFDKKTTVLCKPREFQRLLAAEPLGQARHGARAQDSSSLGFPLRQTLEY